MSSILHHKEGSEVLANVAGNLRRLRQQRGLSQAALAGLSGISRRMIAAIEGDEANVSLSSLDRLAAALGVAFAEIVRPPDARDSRRIESLAWRGAQSTSKGLLLGTAPAAREAELWIWSLGEGERYASEAGSGNWHEMLLVISGTLVIEAADGRHEIAAGDFLIFSSDRPYVFANEGTELVRFARVIVL